MTIKYLVSVSMGVLVSTSLYAQYHPMVVDSANWVVLAASSCNAAGSVYSISGDTVVSDTTYHHVFIRPYIEHHCVEYPEPRPDFKPPYRVGEARKFALIREDTTSQTVYARFYRDENGLPSDILSGDTLIYNFNLQVRDTMKTALTLPEGGFVVSEIDRQQLYGRLRRVYRSENYSEEIIEGVGGTINGPFAIYPYLLTDGEYRLLDYCVGDMVKCNLTLEKPSSIPERSVHGVDVHPTLTQSFVTVRVGEKGAKVERMLLIGINSQVRKQIQISEFNDQNIRVPVHELSTGMYYLCLYFKDGSRGIGRFIKQ